MPGVWNVSGISVAPGATAQGMVQWPGVAPEVPLVLVNGAKDGPLTVILGGIHGCEYTSIDAAIQLSQALKKQDVCGRVAIVPVVAIEAYAARSVYVHPVDKKNLNRTMPGKADGSETERLAYNLFQALLKDCDTVIDLHGGDMNEALVPFIIYSKTPDQALNQKALGLAKAFGIRYIVGSDTVGSTYSVAAASGKLAVLAEAGQQGILDPAGATLLVDGTLNALRWLGVIPGAVVEHPGLKHVDNFLWTRSGHFGAWYPQFQVGDDVVAGQKMGELRDLFGQVLQEVFADATGPVLFSVTSLAINAGDPLFAIGC